MRAAFIYSFSVIISLTLVSANARVIHSDNYLEEGGLLFVFNQPEYAPGDTAYFTGYIPQKNQLAKGKMIVSIKLFGPAKEIIFHGRILFQDGIGISQIIIPQNAVPGNYSFVSYVETNSLTENPIFHTGYIRISSRDFLAEDLRINHLQNDTSSLMIRTDRNKYGRRSKVSVLITLPVDQGKSSLTVASIAVYAEQLFKEIVDGKLMSGAQVTRSGPETNQVKAASKAPNYFLGRAFIKSSGVAVPDSSKITFYLNAHDFAYVVYTSADGNFSFPLFNNFGDDEVFYRITYRGELLRDSQIALHDTSINGESMKNIHSDTLDSYGLFAKQKQFINRSYQYFASKENEDESKDMIISDVEADNEYFLEKFESFPSMAEVFANIIPSVRYRKDGDAGRIRVYLKESAKYGTNDPLYIVDGVMTADTQYILNFDPKIVRKIGVLRSEQTLTRFGDLGLDGILLIETKMANAMKDIAHSENTLSVIGISRAIEYKKLEHARNQNLRTPDLRSSLYWNPKADLDKPKSFEFYTSDNLGSYVIQVAGLIDGKPFLSMRRFYVAQSVNE